MTRPGDRNDWLDDVLTMAIEQEHSEPDFEQWKQAHPEAVKLLNSRASRQSYATSLLSVRRIIMKSRAARLAAAAVIVAAVGLFAIHQRPHQQVPPIAGVVESPAKMMTIMSLSKAYRHGGIDAIDKQFDKVFETLGPRSTSISVGELLEDLNG